VLVSDNSWFTGFDLFENKSNASATETVADLTLKYYNDFNTSELVKEIIDIKHNVIN